MSETSFPTQSRYRIPLLCLSTLALTCLSLTTSVRDTVALGVLWLVCFIRTVCSAKQTNSFPKYNRHAASTYLAAFLLVVLGFNFFYAFTCGSPLELLLSFGIPASVIEPGVLFLTLVGAFVSYPALCIYSQYFLSFLMPVVSLVKKMYRQYIVLSVVYLCGMLSIIRSNFYYIDDLGRAVAGGSIVGSFSRYTARFFSRLIHGHDFLSDISPLPQILAALIMALAAIILLDTLTERSKFRFTDIVCMIPLGLFPYFLECLSYKYDAPYMAFSVLAAVFPLLLYKQNAVKYILASAACTILVCTSYQVSAGIFPMCVAFLCFIRWNQGEKLQKTLTFLYQSIIGYCSGIVFFRLVMMSSIPKDDYVSAAIDLRAFPVNIAEYASRILGDFNLLWLSLFFIILASFLAVGIFSTKRKKIPALLMSLITLLVMFVFSYSLYSILSRPLIYPRAMYGFGVLLSILSCYIVSHSDSMLPRICVCLLAWLVFVFSFTYGNALSMHKEYAQFRMEQVAADLNHLDLMKGTGTKKLCITGTIGRPEGIENMLSVYPVLDDLVPDLFGDSHFKWSSYQLEHYYGIRYLHWDPRCSPPADLELLVDTMYHTIYGNEDYILIELK